MPQRLLPNEGLSPLCSLRPSRWLYWLITPLLAHHPSTGSSSLYWLITPHRPHRPSRWLYWLIGAIYPESDSPLSPKARGAPVNAGKLLSVAVYKMLNSAAHVIGYVLLNRVTGWVQLVGNVVLYALGLVPIIIECSRLGGGGRVVPTATSDAIAE